jgi:PAS domain S-box-containing protein
MTGTDFHQSYAAALHSFLVAGEESSLTVGYELGRQALEERISALEIIENHSRLIVDFATSTPLDGPAALQFLLQTLAPLDVATRGFLDGTRRYEQERARAENLADRDEFRTALVNSLQEGFFVADSDGSVVEVNDAFAEITGFGPDGLPYKWPYPWLADADEAADRLGRLRRDGHMEAETAIRLGNGHTGWVAVSMNKVVGADEDTYVGTIRDITAARAAAVRERAVVRLATAVGVANSVASRRSRLRAIRTRRAGAISIRRCRPLCGPRATACPSPSSLSDSTGLTGRTESSQRSPVRAMSHYGCSSMRFDDSVPKTGCWQRFSSVISVSRCSMSGSSRSHATLRSRSSARCSRRRRLHRGSRCGTSRQCHRWRSAATGTTCCRSASTTSASSSATVWAAVSRQRQ